MTGRWTGTTGILLPQTFFLKSSKIKYKRLNNNVTKYWKIRLIRVHENSLRQKPSFRSISYDVTYCTQSPPVVSNSCTQLPTSRPQQTYWIIVPIFRLCSITYMTWSNNQTAYVWITRIPSRFTRLKISNHLELLKAWSHSYPENSPLILLPFWIDSLTNSYCRFKIEKKKKDLAINP